MKIIFNILLNVRSNIASLTSVFLIQWSLGHANQTDLERKLTDLSDTSTTKKIHYVKNFFSCGKTNALTATVIENMLLTRLACS